MTLGHKVVLALHLAAKLGVECAPLYGFTPDKTMAQFGRFVGGFDLFLWAGATGLSDYPAAAVALLETALRAGVRCALWSVGMNSELNPAFFKAGGKRLTLLKILSFCCGNTLDFPRFYEWFISHRMRRRIGRVLKKCVFVSVRDPESARELVRCGYKDAVVGADPALLLKTGTQEIFHRQRGIRAIGVGISAQRPVRDREAIVGLLNRFLEEKSTRLIFIPMNPRADGELMRSIRDQLDRRNQTLIAENVTDPEAVQALAGECDLVFSSRLHLLILAANAGTPVIGVARGSKVANFLNNFGLSPVCSVDKFNPEGLFCEVERLSDRDNAAAFRKRCAEVCKELLQRLAEAEAAFRKAVTG